MSKFNLISHPILQHKLTKMREKDTNSIGFRGLMNEIGKFLAFEATRNIETETFDIETPVAKTKGIRPKAYPMVVSIMRAGNGMLDGVLETLPYASAGHIGIYRDKFINNTVEYYFKLPPNAKGRDVLLLDPMLATGDTMIAAIDRLKQYNVGKITLLSVLVSPQGLERLHYFHPEVEIYALSKEEGLNDKGYLVPGMGDAGDRLYNTTK
ncbi:uracil phosphoribosyltransferase [Bacteriovorax sp. Seq25_V]|uniref:uracil phosphoribosyltransferase n=1 Tax=Bacteriovorax sp. Seq25_V TaxID=1201288 RepID=UPI00038A367C|nr:uracil phosphoribosyltransferase [Bacteriovorax sp. Seq25_V]EQC44047.1 uracil phosphoribosyltransferase [Bacteriovorax sp. Seq25_V]